MPMFLSKLISPFNFRKKSRLGLKEKFPEYEFGRGTYGDPQILSWNEGATLKIGSFCSIASGVKIFLGGEHRIDWVTTFPFNVFWESANKYVGHPRTKGDVIIGNDVWIGTEALIMSGVTIGDGAVIGARAVITKNVEPYAICVGNPARVIRKRFDEFTVNQLLNIKWWDLEDHQINLLLPLLLSTDIQSFINNAKKMRMAEE